MSAPKSIVLKSSDGQTLEIEEFVAMESQLIKSVIEDGCAYSTIPIPNITGKILAKIFEYCKRHAEAAKAADGGAYNTDGEDLKAFDAEFVKVDRGILFDLMKYPLPTVTGKILAKIIQYCKRHVEAAKAADGSADKATVEDLKAFDAEFVKVVRDILFDLILAADYLNIKTLIDLTCQTVADMINGKTPEEVRRIFNIKNDFTPKEEEEVRRKNAWAFE